ncbi:hypothetical protein KKG90_02445 [Candidatus Bipolaricaulota bacterium]|nr:hypothetical protein [Candidatus Bipolaricaulota bacterium]
MRILKHLAPTLIVATFPTLLLVFRSIRVLRVVFFAAVLGLAFLAGESIARVLPKPVTIGLAITSLLAMGAIVLLGWLEYGVSTPVDLGNLALIAVVVGVPVRAVIVQQWKGKALGNVPG